MAITRRHLLALSAAALAGATLSTGGLVTRWWDRPVAEGLTALSDDEYEFVQALAEAWIPPGGDPALSGADADLGQWMDELVSHMDPTQGGLFRALLQILDDRPIPTWLSPFRALPLEDRQTILRGWIDSELYTIRAAISGVMALLSFGWTLHPQVTPRFEPLFGCGFGR